MFVAGHGMGGIALGHDWAGDEDWGGGAEDIEDRGMENRKSMRRRRINREAPGKFPSCRCGGCFGTEHPDGRVREQAREKVDGAVRDNLKMLAKVVGILARLEDR
jgi:hypothetical protein